MNTLTTIGAALLTLASVGAQAHSSADDGAGMHMEQGAMMMDGATDHAGMTSMTGETGETGETGGHPAAPALSGGDDRDAHGDLRDRMHAGGAHAAPVPAAMPADAMSPAGIPRAMPGTAVPRALPAPRHGHGMPAGGPAAMPASGGTDGRQMSPGAMPAAETGMPPMPAMPVAAEAGGMPVSPAGMQAPAMSPAPAMPGAMAAPGHAGHNAAMPAAGAMAMALPAGHDAHDAEMPAAQGGDAPADARDPHAYADGYTLTGGAYAMPGPRRMRMADEHSFATLRFDRLERVDTRDATTTDWDAQASFGRDYDKLVFKSEGSVADGRLADVRNELLWGHAVSAYWDAQLGWRHDSGSDLPERDWLAFGFQGLAPWNVDVDAAAYLGPAGRTALRLSAGYELLLTQRLILEPRAEVLAYGRRDDARGIGAGLSEATGGLRLRYEITRQLAPYLGVEWNARLAGTADLARAAGEPVRETRWVAGLRFWF